MGPACKEGVNERLFSSAFGFWVFGFCTRFVEIEKSFGDLRSVCICFCFLKRISFAFLWEKRKRGLLSYKRQMVIHWGGISKNWLITPLQFNFCSTCMVGIVLNIIVYGSMETSGFQEWRRGEMWLEGGNNRRSTRVPLVMIIVWKEKGPHTLTRGCGPHSNFLWFLPPFPFLFFFPQIIAFNFCLFYI